jgi:hypothetical protein
MIVAPFLSKAANIQYIGKYCIIFNYVLNCHKAIGLLNRFKRDIKKPPKRPECLKFLFAGDHRQQRGYGTQTPICPLNGPLSACM